MLETTLVSLQDITLDKTLDEPGRKALCSEFPKIMQQVCFLVLVKCLLFSWKVIHCLTWNLDCFVKGYAHLPAGVCASSMGRLVSYEQATVWKVLADDESNHCLSFMFVNWSFV